MRGERRVRKERRRRRGYAGWKKEKRDGGSERDIDGCVGVMTGGERGGKVKKSMLMRMGEKTGRKKKGAEEKENGEGRTGRREDEEREEKRKERRKRKKMGRGGERDRRMKG